MEVHNKCNVHCTSPAHDPKYWHMTRPGKYIYHWKKKQK